MRSSTKLICANMPSLAVKRDVAVPMRDGVRLFANLFRPAPDRRYPAIMSITPYGKDKLPDRVATFFMRLSRVKFGKLNCSRLTGFEAPDPVYWVQQGYAVLQADVRGMHKSEGHAGILRQQDAEDYYDLICARARAVYKENRLFLKARCSIGLPVERAEQFFLSDSSGR
ncbi:MAG: CocE/NonD family hydrolase [Verrucomicrobia bacterium]|nr:CocE/NonD family hydrolase [Verrucomicrobiota bacterium]